MPDCYGLAVIDHDKLTFAPLVRFAVETGMRRGELLNMRWDDMDTDARTLRIPETKTGVPRTIPLSSEAVRILSDLQRNGAPYVFPTSASAVQQAWKRLTRRAGIESFLAGGW